MIFTVAALAKVKKNYLAQSRIQQDEPCHALGLGECPINRRWPGSVVCDKNNAVKLQLFDLRQPIPALDLWRCTDNRPAYRKLPTQENRK
jgi:hypothetical protein